MLKKIKELKILGYIILFILYIIIILFGVGILNYFKISIYSKLIILNLILNLILYDIYSKQK